MLFFESLNGNVLFDVFVSHWVRHYLFNDFGFSFFHLLDLTLGCLSVGLAASFVQGASEKARVGAFRGDTGPRHHVGSTLLLLSVVLRLCPLSILLFEPVSLRGNINYAIHSQIGLLFSLLLLSSDFVFGVFLRVTFLF